MRTDMKNNLSRYCIGVFTLILILLAAGCQLTDESPTGASTASNITTPVNVSDTPNITPHDPSLQIIAANKNTEADFHCDGQSDDVEFQKAIDALPSSGGKIQVIAGKYRFDNTVSVPSNVEIDLSNSIIQLDSPLDRDSAVFTNADKQAGNSGIYIHGGHLVGKDSPNASGNQYGISFTKVTDSRVDSWLEDFSTADQLMIDCKMEFNNRNYDDAYTPQTKWLSRCESVSDFSPSQNLAVETDNTGNKYLTLSTDPGGQSPIRLTRATDLRFYPLVYFNLRDSSKSGTNPYLYLYNDRLKKYIGLNGANFTQFDTGVDGWMQFILSLSTIDWKGNNTTPADFLKDCFFYINLANKSETSTRTYQIDNAYALRGINEGIVTLEFDDALQSVFDNARYMSKYGYRGVVGAIGAATSVSPYHMTLDELKQIYDMGWDVCNHSWGHNQRPLTPGEQWVDDYTGKAYLESVGFSRSAKYRLYTGSQSELTYQESEELYSARRSAVAVGTNLPYGNQQYLSGTQYKTRTIEGAYQLARQAKKFHVWVMPFCHGVSNEGTDYDTSIEVYDKYIDFLYSIGAKVKTISEVYSEYPLANEPHLDFTMQTRLDQYQQIKAASPNSIISDIDLGGVGTSPLTLLSQPDCPRTITWSLASHNQITDFSLVISGVDSRGIVQTETFTGKDGWSGETNNAYKSINSIVFAKVSGTGAGDELNVGIGSRLGISRGIFHAKDITSVTKNGAAYSTEKYKVDATHCTVDVSAGEKISAGDNFTIEYSSNFNDLLWLKFQ